MLILQIIKNLTKDPSERRTHALIGTALLVVICFFNTVPMIFITVLANAQSVSQLTLLHYLILPPSPRSQTVAGHIPTSRSSEFP